MYNCTSLLGCIANILLCTNMYIILGLVFYKMSDCNIHVVSLVYHIPSYLATTIATSIDNQLASYTSCIYNYISILNFRFN